MVCAYTRNNLITSNFALVRSVFISARAASEAVIWPAWTKCLVVYCNKMLCFAISKWL